MNQKDIGTVECIKGGPDACSPHLGHHPDCARGSNTAAQKAARAAFDAAMGQGGMPGMPGMPAMMSQYPMPQHAQMHPGVMGPAVYPGGIGAPMPPQGPQRVGVDVMSQTPNGGGYGAPWGGQNGGPAHPQLGQGNGNGVGYSNGVTAPAGGKGDRLERTSLAIACAVIQGLTHAEFKEQSTNIALDSVRAARALLDEVDGIIRMGAGS